MTSTPRDHTRIKMDTRVFVEVVAADESNEGLLLQCDVVDVSYGGFSANIASELIIGSILSVCAELPAVPEPFYMVAEVKWCRPDAHAQHSWLAGFQLLSSSNTDIEHWRSLLVHV